MAARLAVCLLNISEAQRREVVEKVAKAAAISATKDSKFKCLSTVLNIFSDHDYNRSVLTIAAPIENLQTAVMNACKVAFQEISLQNHTGNHPRLGSVDLIPIYPISPSVSLNECGDIAKGIGKQIVSEVPGSSVFFFGTADCPRTRGLVERRKEVGWYKGGCAMSYDGVKFDLGHPPMERYGLTGVGASPYVMNCNVTIETEDLPLGQRVARAIRGASPGGLKGVQAMAFNHQGSVEIACNVEAFLSDQVGWS
jgi:glutamate formiminotransferase